MIDGGGKGSGEDDAANANWGGSWRMPTNAEMNALLALSREWVTYEGVKGYKFTGNGKTLFLPAAGYRFGTSLDEAGSYGFYWSSSLYGLDSDSARTVGFGSDDDASSSYDTRYYGQSVRPVTE